MFPRPLGEMSTHHVSIGGLPSSVSKTDVSKLLADLSLPSPDFMTIKRNGIVLLSFSEAKEASLTIATLNGSSYCDSILTVESSVKFSSSASIKLTGLPNDVTEDKIKDLIESLHDTSSSSTATATATTTFSLISNEESNTSSVILNFPSKEAGQEAFELLEGLSFEGHPINVIKVSKSKGRESSSRRLLDFPLRILVSSEMVGAIIGRAGQTIRNITQQTRARVDVHRKENVGSLEKAVTIYGQAENCSKAALSILRVMREEGLNTGKSEEEIPLKILAHNNLIGRIIGKQGSTIKKIMSETETKIRVSSINSLHSFNMERIITIFGNKLEALSKAESEVSAKLRAAYESDINALASHHNVMFPGGGLPLMSHPPPFASSSFLRGGGMESYYSPPSVSFSKLRLENSETTHLYLPNTFVGAVIGLRGSAIREVMKVSGASVKISDPLSDSEFRKVTIVGSPESQWMAQNMICEKLGEELATIILTLEIMIPSNQVGKIIGKRGCNVRDIQRSTGAVVKLPESDSSKNEEGTSVQISGTFYCLQAGQRRIRSMITNP